MSALEVLVSRLCNDLIMLDKGEVEAIEADKICPTEDDDGDDGD